MQIELMKTVTRKNKTFIIIIIILNKHSRGALIELGSRNKQDPLKVINTC